MFSTIETRPNIAFVTSPRSLFAKNPSYFHIEAVKTIPNYLKGSKDWGLEHVWGGDAGNWRATRSFVSWVRNRESRKSRSGYIILLNEEPDSSRSKRQSTCGSVIYPGKLSTLLSLFAAAEGAIWLTWARRPIGWDQRWKTRKYRGPSVDGGRCAKKLKETVTHRIGPLWSNHSLPKSIDMRVDNQGSIALAHTTFVFHPNDETNRHPTSL